MNFCCDYSRLDLPCNCPPVRDVETTRESFEEKAYITYFMSHVTKELQLSETPVNKEEFALRDSEGDYLFEGLDTLWVGWKWCYEICKVPVK